MKVDKTMSEKWKTATAATIKIKINENKWNGQIGEEGCDGWTMTVPHTDFCPSINSNEFFLSGKNAGCGAHTHTHIQSTKTENKSFATHIIHILVYMLTAECGYAVAWASCVAFYLSLYWIARTDERTHSPILIFISITACECVRDAHQNNCCAIIIFS